MTDNLFSLSGVDLDPAPFVGPVYRHPLYGVLMNMRRRCHNPDHAAFPSYGGRGIVVCDEWRNSSRSFVAWAISAGWRTGLQIDRRDNDGPYSPENCRFVTAAVNNRNRRDTIRVGGGLVLADVARAAGLDRDAIKRRLVAGLSLEDALASASGVRRPQRRFADGSVALDVARRNGISADTFNKRVSRGWPLERAVTEPPQSRKLK